MLSLIETDLALTHHSKKPSSQKLSFNWSSLVYPETNVVLNVVFVKANGEIPFHMTEVADTVGAALADVLRSRGESDIFTDGNRAFVSTVLSTFRIRLEAQAKEQAVTINTSGLYGMLEGILADLGAYDVAKCLYLNGARPGRHDNAELRVIRRNQQIVPFNGQKIEVVIRKAFLAMKKDSSPAVSIAKAVEQRALSSKQSFLHIEEIQDMVQEELMKAGHFKIAEHFILYRNQRLHQRKSTAHVPETTPKISTMLVRADGQTVKWDRSDLRKRIEFASMGLDLCLTSAEIEEELVRSLSETVTAKDLAATILLNSKTLIEKDADFSKFAGRIQLTYIYEEVLGWDIATDGLSKLKELHRAQFKKYLEYGVSIKRLNPDLLKLKVDVLADAFDPSSDLEFDFLGVQTMYDRYLIIDKTRKPAKRIETPQFFWMRVAMGLFLGDQVGNVEEKIIGLYELYKSRRFCSSTPTLFNSGTLHSQLSSCYLYYVEDSLEGIMYRGIAENALLSKWAGGLGGSWTAVRGTGAHIAGTNGESQGVIPFLKLHNDQLVAVNQGGKRKGSGCAYIETWHADMFEFLELRKNTGDDRRRTHDMNTANWIPDLFMKRMENRQPWTLFRSNETPDLHELYGKKFEEAYVRYEKLAEEGKIHGQKVEALELWKKMLSMLFETGHPWITFKDACNIRSPQDHVGVIHSSNLCTEITLNTSKDETAVCNLGSVILENHLLSDGSIDHKKLRATIRMAVRALDNVIDINFYPTEAAKRSNQRHRPIGLGVMGLANACYIKGIAFASEAAVEFNDEAMEAIAFYAYEASSDLAAERGTYSTFKGSKWDRGLLPQDTIDLLETERGVKVNVPRGGKMDWAPVRAKIAKHGMRNSNVLAIAPTATISNITNTSPCIEPTYKNLFVKSNLSGEFIVLNPFLVKDLKARGLWDQDIRDSLKYFDGELKDIERIPADLKAKYLTAFDIDFKWILDGAARRQKWIDQAQSVNLWIKTPDMKTLSHMYRHAWHVGLKTTYYLRSLGASTIEKSTVQVKKEVRGVAGTDSSKKTFTEAEKSACSIEAQRNGEECQACQ